MDPPGKGNLFSPTLRSRVDIRRAVGGRALCEDLRTGCGVLVDDRAGPFSALDFAYGRQSLRPVRPARCAERDPGATAGGPLAREAQRCG